ncbi:hypothetical protein CAS74_002902 [Pichia kudriavzevii]|uniref:Uncharacterized protein n=1 Tax=Pichia kudriavzevii TaxID=4909 RepID=A0A1Z8JMV1_PICKU|nr:hypothetical protein CAS74_002902 [Pichia kudriavzevii]
MGIFSKIRKAFETPERNRLLDTENNKQQFDVDKEDEPPSNQLLDTVSNREGAEVALGANDGDKPKNHLEDTLSNEQADVLLLDAKSNEFPAGSLAHVTEHNPNHISQGNPLNSARLK